MASNITKNFDQRKKFGLRMAAGGILSTKQDDSTLFSAPGSDVSSKMALSLASQAQPQDAVAANSSLSNTDRFKMANPTGDAYGIDGKMKGVVSVTPGSSAENSMLNEQGSLRQNMTDASNMSRLRRVDSMTGGNGLDMYRNSLSSGRGASARFGLGLRAGGVVDPEQAEVYEIDGPGDGSGVDDKTQVNVHGKKINVSKGERFAVFPAKVPAENIEEFIESQTGEPSATAGGRGLREGMRAMTGAQGSTIDPRELRPEFRSAAQTPVIEPTAKPSAENLRTVNAERAATKAAEAYKPAMNTGSANDALRAAGKLPGGPSVAAPAPAAATEAVGEVGKKAALRGALSYAGPVATGVGLGMGAASYMDSFPSLRGKATASDSNAELAGTPQHQAVQNEERVAADDAWEKRHGKSLGDQHARVTTGAAERTMLPQASYGNEGRRAVNSDVIVPSDQSRAESLAQARNEIRANQLGLSAGQLDVLRKTTGSDAVPAGFKNGSWTSKNDVAGDYNDRLRGTQPGDSMRLADGQGIASMRQKDGTYKNITVDGNPIYTGADGKPTTSWYDTQAYKDATARAQQDKLTLRSMQQDRLMRDLGDDIKDPRVKAGAIAGLAAMNEQDKTVADKAYKTQGLRLQQAQLERDLRKDAQAQSNADRTHNAGRDDKFKARVDDLLKSSSTVDGKLDNARYSAMQQYAAKIPREMVRDEKTGEPREMDDNEYYAWLVDNMSLDQGLGVAGEHWFSAEKPWAGERTRYVRENASGNLHRGAPMQSIQYRDPDSGRIVYQSDIEKLSPSQQKAFYKRVEGN